MKFTQPTLGSLIKSLEIEVHCFRLDSGLIWSEIKILVFVKTSIVRPVVLNDCLGGSQENAGKQLIND